MGKDEVEALLGGFLTLKQLLSKKVFARSKGL